MENEIEKIIEERLKKLPEKAVKVIKSINLREKVTSISKNNNFDENKEQLFTIEVLLLVLGIESPTKFPENLAEKVGLDDESVAKIANDVDEKILTPITLALNKENSTNIRIDKNKLIEISKKYSLNQSQTDKLFNYLSTAGKNLNENDVIINSIITNIGVSRLIAEQIFEEIKNRVVEQPKNTSRLPEVKPNNLPAVEIGESVKVNPPPKAQPTPNIDKKEPVQRPYTVPRFGMSQMKPKVEVINLANQKPENPQNMMDNKLKTITTSPTETPPKPPVVTPNMPPTKYSADPYREPTN